METQVGVSGRAMLLDASVESAALTRRVLSDAGVELVEWAVSGAGWVSPWQKTKPDICVVDLQLPKRDGLYCLEKIVSLDPDAVVIFTHSYIGLLANDVETKALALGAAAVVQKPWLDSRMQASVARALRQVQNKRRLLYR